MVGKVDTGVEAVPHERRARFHPEPNGAWVKLKEVLEAQDKHPGPRELSQGPQLVPVLLEPGLDSRIPPDGTRKAHELVHSRPRLQPRLRRLVFFMTMTPPVPPIPPAPPPGPEGAGTGAPRMMSPAGSDVMEYRR